MVFLLYNWTKIFETTSKTGAFFFIKDVFCSEKKGHCKSDIASAPPTGWRRMRRSIRRRRIRFRLPGSKSCRRPAGRRHRRSSRRPARATVACWTRPGSWPARTRLCDSSGAAWRPTWPSWRKASAKWRDGAADATGSAFPFQTLKK